MAAVVGQWLVRYAPGDWVLLAGPTSVLLLPPEAAHLALPLWRLVVGAASIHDLAAGLAGPTEQELPAFAAFFWGADGMRSLVRGDVAVRSDDDEVLADGAGVQTWAEIGLGGVERVRVGEWWDPEELLPLVVGAVWASTVILDGNPAVRVVSPQASAHGSAAQQPDLREGDSDEEAEVETEKTADRAGEVEFDRARLDMENGDTQLVLMPVDVRSTDRPTEAAPAPADPSEGASEPEGPTVLGTLCPRGHVNAPGATSCRVCGSPVAPQSPRPLPQPSLAVLRCSDGSELPLDRSVLVGRAPSAVDPDAGAARLLTVLSPGQDISRTHVEIGVAGWQPMVRDLRSTNGTLLIDPQGASRILPPGQPVPAQLGSVVDLGDGISILIDFPQ